MKIQDVLDKKLKDIDISKGDVEKLWNLAEGVICELKKKGVDAFVGGSLAKGTLIKKDEQDIDIFVVFKDESGLMKLESVLKKIKFQGELKLVHGSRNYFQILNPIAKIELIPTIETKSPEDAENVTDVSLSHVKYVVGMIKKNKEIAKEIKLAKAFCQAQRCYGAESYIKGFSGYSLEVLVIYFGSFINFLKKIGGVRGIGEMKKKVIDSKKYFKDERQVLFELNASKLQSPLVVVDPTYRYRNVTAGLGEETFVKFLDVAKQFLKRPSLEFFEKQEIDVEKLKIFSKKEKACLLKIDLMTDRQEGDIAGTKCKKFLDFFANELGRSEQVVLRKEFDYSGFGQKALGYLVVREKEVIEICGPPVSLNDSVEGFKKEHKDNYVKKGRVCAKKNVSVKDIFDYANEVRGEMGSWGEKLARI